MPVDPGTAIGPYVVDALLGNGAMASVYRVHDASGRSFALKLLDLPSRHVRERLALEGRIQAALRHPNLVGVVDQATYEDCPGLVMDFVDGPTLGELRRSGPLDLATIDAIATGLMQGLAAAHRLGVVHRDLKPANVLMDGTTPRITDFGLVKVLDDTGTHRTRTGQLLGTPAYMAVEQFRNARDVDPRADVYSLGVMLYELVAGERPYRGATIHELMDQVLRGEFVPPRDRVPGLPARMDRAIVAALQADRERRPDVAGLARLWSDGALVIEPIGDGAPGRFSGAPEALGPPQSGFGSIAPTAGFASMAPAELALADPPPRPRWPIVAAVVIPLVVLAALAGAVLGAAWMR